MLNKQQIEKAFHLLCSADEAARVSWRVVGMRAALLSYAFASHFVLKSREDARLALGLNEQDWARFGNYILEYWQESEVSGQLMLTPPKAARQARARKGVDIFAPSSFGKAMPLIVVPTGPTKVAELPGELAAKAAQETFEAVWAAYPNKSNKTYAHECFKRLRATGDDLKAILSDIALRQFTKKWTDGGGAYIPNPSTYFNNKVWTEQIVLTELELAVSVLPADERLAFYAKPRREIESWLGSQKVLGRVPSQADLQAHVGIGSPHAVRPNDLHVVDVQCTEPVGAEVVASASSDVALMPQPTVKPALIDPFEVEFMRAVDTIGDPQKRERIIGRDPVAKRQWLNAFQTMRAAGGGAASQSSPPATPSLTRSSASDAGTGKPTLSQVRQVVQEPPEADAVTVSASTRPQHEMFERKVWM